MKKLVTSAGHTFDCVLLTSNVLWVLVSGHVDHCAVRSILKDDKSGFNVAENVGTSYPDEIVLIPGELGYALCCPIFL